MDCWRRSSDTLSALLEPGLPDDVGSRPLGAIPSAATVDGLAGEGLLPPFRLKTRRFRPWLQPE